MRRKRDTTGGTGLLPRDRRLKFNTVISMRPLLIATLTVIALESAIVGSLHAQPTPPARHSPTIMVGNIVGLTPDGILRTVVSVATDPGDLVVLGIRYTRENASDYCQRKRLLKPGSREFQTCIDNSEHSIFNMVLNCKERLITWSGGVYQKSSENDFWQVKADTRRVILGDKIFRQSCG
jgi:hypothetical protein